MESRFLESLIAVAEKGSIAEAARSQGLTPAAVRQRLSALDVELGTAMFLRSGRSVRPTETCLRLLPEAKRIVEDINSLRATLNDSALRGVLKIGSITTAMMGSVAGALENLSKDAPDLEAEIHPGTSPHLYERVCSGELDIVIVIKPPHPIPKGLQIHEIRREPLILLTQKPSKRSLRDSLHQQPYIRYDPNSWGGMRAEHFLHDNRISPNIFCTMDALRTIPLLVHKGLGVSLIPDWTESWPQELKWSEKLNLAWRSIDNSKYDRSIVAIHKRAPSKQRAIAAFLGAMGLA